MTEKVEKDWLNADAKESEYEFVAEVEWEDQSYQFDMTRVYLHKPTGELYYAEDSGCSCPSPFEDTTTDDLKPIMRMQDWYDHVKDRTIQADPSKEYQYPDPTPTSALDEAETARRAIASLIEKAAK